MQERAAGLGDIFTQNTLSAIKAVCQVLALGLCGREGALGGRRAGVCVSVCVSWGDEGELAPCKVFRNWWATGDHTSACRRFLTAHNLLRHLNKQ